MKIRDHVWYPSIDDVIALHYELVALFVADDNPISPPGPRDIHLLESALGRPRTSLGGVEKYGWTKAKAAALFHSLVKNHAFHNGNKRTALMTLITFLWRNDLRFVVTLPDDELFTMVVGVANDTFAPPGSSPDDVVFALTEWLEQRIVSHKAKTPGMRTKDFLVACENAGLTWKESGGSYVVSNVLHKVRFSRSTRHLDPPIIRAYLARLGIRDILVDEFQRGSPDLAEGQRFRQVLRRLANA